MGMRSAAKRCPRPRKRPAAARAPMLRVAAAAQAAEAAGLCVAVVLNVIDSASGHAWTASNAIAFIVLEVIVAIGVAAIASGHRPRPAVEPDPGGDDPAVHRHDRHLAA